MSDTITLTHRIFRSHRGDGIEATIRVVSATARERDGSVSILNHEEAKVTYWLDGQKVSREDFLAIVALGGGR